MLSLLLDITPPNKLLIGLFKTVGELDGEKMDLEKSPSLKEMEFVELTWIMISLLPLTKKY